MNSRYKIAIIGDFNFTYNTHHATNLAMDHAKELLDMDVSYYWVRIHEAANYKNNDFLNYDAVWFAPGPFENIFFLTGVMKRALESKLPLLITGDAFKEFIELLIAQNNLNGNQEKLISDNLVMGEQYEKVQVTPASKTLKKMYNDMVRLEVTATRYSLYPQLISYLTEEVIDVEAKNQFDDLEIISLKNHPFCVASMSIVQICSTRDMPHPLVTGFLNYVQQSRAREVDQAG
jgi:CTP synthase (UTP-ammonia lyase)